MIKKIVVISTLMSTLAFGDMKEKGFFVGLDLNHQNLEISYDSGGPLKRTESYISKDAKNILSGKFGYQYYFTRLYARIGQSKEFEDKHRDYFKIKNQVFELNADYIPILYIDNLNKWNVRGIIGVGVGFNRSSLLEYNALLDTSPDSILDTKKQYSMEYGYNLGVMAEFDFGLSAEVAYRMRSGIMTQFSNGTGGDDIVFLLDSGEFYLGLNYLF